MKGLKNISNFDFFERDRMIRKGKAKGSQTNLSSLMCSFVRRRRDK